MAVITPYTPSVVGTPPTPAAANNADQAQVGENRWLVVINGSAGEIDVTITVPGNLATGDAYPDRIYVVAAGATVWIPLLSVYGNADGLADIEYESVTSVTRYVLRV